MTADSESHEGTLPSYHDASWSLRRAGSCGSILPIGKFR